MEPHNFNCEIIDGHCIIRDQGNVILLDTGSPVTIHETKTLKFLGDDFATQDQYQTNIPELRHLTGLDDLTTLMGTDILRQYKLWFNYKYQKVIFGSPNMQSKGYTIPVKMVHGIPLIKTQIGEVSHNTVLDSGARLSYLTGKLTQGLHEVGNEQDFYPGLGFFNTPTFEVLTITGEKEIPVKYGKLPTRIEPTMAALNCSTIIGYDLFRNFAIYLDLEGPNGGLMTIMEPF